MKKMFYLLKEKEGREENGYVAEYDLLEREPNVIQKGWEVGKIEVETTEELNRVLIKEQYGGDHIFGIINAKADRKTIQKVIDEVRKIDGYNENTMFDVLSVIFKGCEVETLEEIVYF